VQERNCADCKQTFEMAMMIFKEEVLEDLKKIFENEELETINLLLEGKAKSNSTKNTHLETYRKMITVLSKELKWNSEKNKVAEKDVIESSPEDKDKDIEDIIDEKSESEKDVKKEKENDSKDLKDKVCYFFRTKTCKHGKSGKIPDKSGNKCSYNHPSSVCKKFENYGDTDKGCQDSQCNKMHVVHCRHFILGKCNLDKKCKFFHQKNLQKKPQVTKNNQHRGAKANEKSSENQNKIQRAPKNVQKSEDIDFLGQSNPHQMACGNCRTNSHFCPQQNQVHQCSQKQDQIQNNPNQIKDVFLKIINLIHQNI
jgi:hypothetical protein